MKNSIYIIDQKQERIFRNWEAVFIYEKCIEIAQGNGRVYVLGIYQSEKAAHDAFNKLINAIRFNYGNPIFIMPPFDYAENNPNQ